MLNLNILKNSFEQNLKPPAKNGDIGFDLVAAEVKVVGATYNNGPEEIILNDPEKDLRHKIWKSIKYIEYNTKIRYELFNTQINLGEFSNAEQNLKYFGFGPPRSSNSNYNLLLCNSCMTIDLGYRGDIKVRYKYIADYEDIIGIYPDGRFGCTIDYNKIYKVGDKVAQLLFLNFATPTIKFVDNLSETERKDSGFGSTN